MSASWVLILTYICCGQQTGREIVSAPYSTREGCEAMITYLADAQRVGRCEQIRYTPL